VSQNLKLSVLANDILSVKSLVSFITNYVVSLMHACVSKAYMCYFHSPFKQANCKAYTHYFALHRDDTCLYQILYSSHKSRCMSSNTKCHCKLCAKDMIPSLKSPCINKLHKKSNLNFKIIKKNICVYYLPTVKKRNLFFKLCSLCFNQLCLYPRRHIQSACKTCCM